MTSQQHTHDLVGVDCCAACHDEKARLQDALRPYPEPRPIKVTVHLDGRREVIDNPEKGTEMTEFASVSDDEDITLLYEKAEPCLTKRQFINLGAALELCPLHYCDIQICLDDGEHGNEVYDDPKEGEDA